MERLTTAFRKLLANHQLIVVPGAYDPYTARLIESLGFQASYLGGSAVGTQLCTSEPLITLTEMVQASSAIVRAITTPLIVDADAGFGDAIHTQRTVHEFEHAGVAAIHIEDQPFPKRAHYHKGSGRVVSLEEAKERIQAALAARQDPDFVIIGRTDALRASGSVSEAAARCEMYVDAGADMLMVLGPPSVDQARELRRAFATIPMVWLSGAMGPELSIAEVEDLGYDVVIVPVMTSVIITDALLEAYSHLRGTGSLSHTEDAIAATRRKIDELLGMEVHWQIEEKTTERRRAAE